MLHVGNTLLMPFHLPVHHWELFLLTGYKVIVYHKLWISFNIPHPFLVQTNRKIKVRLLACSCQFYFIMEHLRTEGHISWATFMDGLTWSRGEEEVFPLSSSGLRVHDLWRGGEEFYFPYLL